MPPRMYNLRMIYELRKTTPLGPRPCVARLFFKESKPGLVDGSGALWPVHVPPDLLAQLGEGDVLEFTALSQNMSGASSKYNDDGFLISVMKLIQVTPCRGPWTNSRLHSPIPERDCFPHDADHTCFASAPCSDRQKLLHIRTNGLERTRRFFTQRGFQSMETPCLVPSGGVEVYLSGFHTEYTDVRGKRWPLSLPTSPEFALKKLLAEGFAKVFQISHAFRNAGELARWHEPEFLMLEWYRTGGNLDSMMEDTRDFVLALEEEIGEGDPLPKRWPRFTVAELFRRHCAIDLEKCASEEEFRRAGRKASASVVDTDDWDSVFCKLFMERIEPALAKEKACFVSHYPRRMGALARVSDNPFFVDRFEAYLHGVEICNGYHELTDTDELAARFDGIATHRPEEVRRDVIFEETMRFGLPPCSGNALGIDRVIALLAGLPHIAALMPIPFLSQFPAGTVAPE